MRAKPELATLAGRARQQLRAQLETWGGDARTGTLAIALLAGFGLSAWWAQRAREAADRHLLAAHTGADYFVRDLDAQTYSEQGHVTEELRAVRLVHYPRDGHAVVTDPALTRRRPDGGRVHIHASQGFLRDRDGSVRLAGDVEVRVLRGGDVPPVIMRTPDLHYDPAADRASTDRPVRIESASAVTEGEGFAYDAATGRLTIGGRVRAVILPARSRP
jgi:LPS export ABC transporter protein LptC